MGSEGEGRVSGLMKRMWLSEPCWLLMLSHVSIQLAAERGSGEGLISWSGL